MSIAPAKPLALCTSALEAVEELCGVFGDFAPDAADFTELPAESLPLWARRMLAHEQHMTRVLEQTYRAPIDLYVMRYRAEGDSYTRKIFLTTRGGSSAVEYGVVRLDLRWVSGATRSEIVSQQAPLGSILMRHNVLRRIQPIWFMHVAVDSRLMRWFGARPDADLYGRIGVIWCNGERAVELIEIVPQPPENP